MKTYDQSEIAIALGSPLVVEQKEGIEKLAELSDEEIAKFIRENFEKYFRTKSGYSNLFVLRLLEERFLRNPQGFANLLSKIVDYIAERGELSYAFIELLGETKDKTYLPLILSEIVDTRRNEINAFNIKLQLVRASCFVALAKLGEIRKLEEEFEKERTGWVREVGICFIEKYGDKESIEFLVRFREKCEPELKIALNGAIRRMKLGISKLEDLASIGIPKNMQRPVNSRDLRIVKGAI